MRIRVYNQSTLLYKSIHISEVTGCIREVHVCETLVGMHRVVNLLARKSVIFVEYKTKYNKLFL